MLILTYCCEAANQYVIVKPAQQHLQKICLVFVCIDLSGLFADETVAVKSCGHNAKQSQV